MAEHNHDTQSEKYQLTINQPEEKGMTHKEIRKILTSKFKTLAYACMADEQGSTYHTHVFVCFYSRVRFSTIKRNFPQAHIEPAKGTVSQNVSYIQKSGKWADTQKSETTIEGSFEELETKPPDSKGRRSDMSELYQMVSDGLSNAEILAVNQDYILNIDKIDKVRTTILTERYKNTRRLDLHVIYISGATGTNKTRSILDKHGDANVYRVTEYEHGFDSYTCQPVIAFEEFRSSLRLKDMLNYLDIYPIELPARYCNKFACYNTAYVISNWELERQYEELQASDSASWKAFLRRIHEVWVYTEKGEAIIYDSVKQYMERNREFRPLTKEEQMKLPFHTD